MADAVTHDAAATVKARRAANPKKPQAVLARTDEVTDEPPSRPLGVTADPASPAHTLTGSWVAGHITSADYAVARNAAYFSWYPEGCQQPSTKLLWNAGQHVLRDYYQRYGGDNAAATPEAATPVNEPGGGLLHASRGTQSIG